MEYKSFGELKRKAQDKQIMAHKLSGIVKVVMNEMYSQPCTTKTAQGIVLGWANEKERRHEPNFRQYKLSYFLFCYFIKELERGENVKEKEKKNCAREHIPKENKQHQGTP